METYRPRGSNTGGRNAGIYFPLTLWQQIMKAAYKAEMSASAWVRLACREKLERS